VAVRSEQPRKPSPKAIFPKHGRLFCRQQPDAEAGAVHGERGLLQGEQRGDEQEGLGQVCQGLVQGHELGGFNGGEPRARVEGRGYARARRGRMERQGIATGAWPEIDFDFSSPWSPAQSIFILLSLSSLSNSPISSLQCPPSLLFNLPPHPLFPLNLFSCHNPPCWALLALLSVSPSRKLSVSHLLSKQSPDHARQRARQQVTDSCLKLAPNQL
jgi:hypothetical protein